MSDLSEKKCIPCEGNIPPFDTDEIHKYLKKIDGWEVIEDKIDGFHLIKNFKFENFLQSQDFVNEVGKIAEIEGHHLAHPPPTARFRAPHPVVPRRGASALCLGLPAGDPARS